MWCLKCKYILFVYSVDPNRHSEFKLLRLDFIYNSQSVFIYNVPGAGELITGPTVLGDPMAAGNLICASPPYLITTTTTTTPKELLLIVCAVQVIVNMSML